MDIPTSRNVAHQVERQVTALQTDEVEDLLSDSNFRAWSSGSVAEIMTSALGLALRTDKEQYGVD